MTIFCEEYEKNLYEGYAQWVLMNGEVVRWEDQDLLEENWKQADFWMEVFYNGYP